MQVYDGDTSMEERPGARERARLLITNPDMLHQSFLPVHRQFADFLANLHHVIVDEGHYYRCGGRQRRLVSGVYIGPNNKKRQASFKLFRAQDVLPTYVQLAAQHHRDASTDA